MLYFNILELILNYLKSQGRVNEFYVFWDSLQGLSSEEINTYINEFINKIIRKEK